jgi:hypothetical protein
MARFSASIRSSCSSCPPVHCAPPIRRRVRYSAHQTTLAATINKTNATFGYEYLTPSPRTVVGQPARAETGISTSGLQRAHSLIVLKSAVSSAWIEMAACRFNRWPERPFL